MASQIENVNAAEPLAAPAAPVARLSEMHFQVDADAAIGTLATQAAAAWSRALGIAVTVASDGDIPILSVDAFQPGCAEAVIASGHPSKIDACSSVQEPPSAGHTEILTRKTEADGLYQTILHEMGHHLSGRQGHLPPDSNVAAIMLEVPYPYATALTAEDVEWVCGGPRMACH